MSCQCDVCRRYREFMKMNDEVFNEGLVEHYEFFNRVYDYLCETEQELEYYKAVVEGRWPNSENVLASYRGDNEFQKN